MTDDINTALETVREALETDTRFHTGFDVGAALAALDTIETTLQEQEAALFGHHAELTRLRAERDGVEKAHEELDAEFAEVCAERDEAIQAWQAANDRLDELTRNDRVHPERSGVVPKLRAENEVLRIQRDSLVAATRERDEAVAALREAGRELMLLFRWCELNPEWYARALAEQVRDSGDYPTLARLSTPKDPT